VYLALQVGLLAILTTATPTYRLRILPVPEGCISWSYLAHGLSDSGSAIGNLECANSTDLRAVVWDAAGFHMLSTLGGRSSYAFGISRDGATILGAANTEEIAADGRYVTPPVLWRSGKIVELETLGGPYGAAIAMDPRGAVVGACESAEIDPRVNRVPLHACRWSDSGGSPSDLGGLGGLGGPDAEAIDVNKRGWIVGWASTATPDSSLDGFAHVAFLHDGSGTISLGTLGGDWSEAFAVNEAGEVVGQSETVPVDGDGPRGSRAFAWRSGVMRELGTIAGGNSFAWDINGRGEIVGTSQVPVPGQRGLTVATLWRGGRVWNLNDLVDDLDGWTLGDATAIDDSGHILVQAYRAGAVRIAILDPHGP
jgi:probable HAF family extracellular repeat protein